ncbi:MAG: hypothetical protein KDJ44_19640 [Rhodoblastus sp.]|nr:hypothetical protein [Rhodoblastus sp.]
MRIDIVFSDRRIALADIRISQPGARHHRRARIAIRANARDETRRRRVECGAVPAAKARGARAIVINDDIPVSRYSDQLGLSVDLSRETACQARNLPVEFLLEPEIFLWRRRPDTRDEQCN